MNPQAKLALSKMVHLKQMAAEQLEYIEKSALVELRAEKEAHGSDSAFFKELYKQFTEHVAQIEEHKDTATAEMGIAVTHSAEGEELDTNADVAGQLLVAITGYLKVCDTLGKELVETRFPQETPPWMQ